MIKIGDIEYPNTYETVRADNALWPVFKRFCEKALLMDNVSFLEALAKPINAEWIYRDFFSYDGKFPINIGPDPRSLADAMAEEGNWQDASWTDVFDTARREILALLQFDVLADKFWKDAIFLDHHEQQNGGSRDDARQTHDDPDITRIERAARLLRLQPSDALASAIDQYEKNGDTLRTMSAFDAYAKEQGSTLAGPDMLRVLMAQGVIRVKKLYNTTVAAGELNTNKIRVLETFFAAYKNARNDGRALWTLLTELRNEVGGGATPSKVMKRLLKEGLIEPGAEPIDPATEEEDIPPPPPPTDEDDMPPPPPPTDEDDIPPPPPPLDEDEELETAGSDIDPDDLPPPPPFGDVRNYTAHMDVIRKVRSNKKLLPRALQALKDAMVKNNDCAPDVSLKRLAEEVATVLRNTPDPFPEVERDPDPFPEARAPIPNGDDPQDDPFPDTGPVGVDLSGLDEDDIGFSGGGSDDDDSDDDDSDDGSDPFPERPAGNRGQRRREDRIPDDESQSSDTDRDDGLSVASGDSAQERTGAASGTNDLKPFLKAAVAKIAARIADGDVQGAKTSAGQTSKMMAKLGGPSAAVSSVDIFAAAQKQAGRIKTADVETPGDDVSAGVKVGGVELKNDHANKADWKMFGKQYALDDESVASCRQIGLAIVKTGAESPKALSSAKSLADQINKDKKAKFKFKNYKHVMAAVLQLVQFKATKQKLMKPLKASDVKDVLTEHEDA